MPASSNRNNQAYIVNASDSIVTLTRFCFFVTSQPSYIFIRCSGQVRRCVPQQAGKAVDTTSPPHFHFPQAPHCARLVYNNPPANYTAVMEGIDSLTDRVVVLQQPSCTIPPRYRDSSRSQHHSSTQLYPAYLGLASILQYIHTSNYGEGSKEQESFSLPPHT